MNERKAGALLSYLNIFLAIVIQFAYTPVMLRILGQSEFGVYSLSESVIAYLSLLNFGFSGSYLKFYSKYKAQNDILSIKKLNAIYLIVFAAIAVFICIGGYAIIQNINLIVGKNFTDEELQLTKILMVIMTLNMAAMMPNNAFTSITVAHEKFIFAKALAIFKTIGSPLFSLPVLLFGYGSKGMSIVLLVITLISLALNIHYCKQKIKVGFEFYNLNWTVLKEILSFSVFIFLWSIVDQLNWQIGKVILANIIGSAAVAVYTIGMHFTSLFMVFSTAISGVFTPQIYNYVYECNAAKKLSDLMIKVGRLQFYVVFFIWIAFVIFGRQFIVLWAGPEYEKSYFIGLLLMTPIVIALMQNVGIEILRAYNKHQVRTLLHLLLALVNVVISIPLTKIYGEIGCALGSCISTFISSTLVSNYFYSKVINLDIKRFFKELLKFIPSMSILGIVGIMIVQFTKINTWIDFIVLCFIFTAFYGVIMWKFAFNEYEKGLLFKAVNKIAQKSIKLQEWNMKEILKAKNECCGCSACYDICPKNAISMVEDDEGFRYPQINEEKCISCGLCKKACPAVNVKNKTSKLLAYAAYNLDEKIRLASSSGGMFSLIAGMVLKNNGVVYGAAFDKKFEVEHIRITEVKDLNKLRGSKYAQSKCDGIYKVCKQDLDAGKKVLFSGTPCQIEALNSYLNRKYDNLLCVDIICHGVPSRAVWRKYMQYRVNFAKSKIEQIAFRLKNEGWKQYAVQFVFANRTAYCQNLHKDIFMRGFLKNLFLRPSCYVCKFKRKERVSDLTLADFWGINSIYPAIDDDKGMSLVIVHSEQGVKVFDELKPYMFYKEADIDKAISYNSSMVSSVKASSHRESFFKEIADCQNIESIIYKYTQDFLKDRLKIVFKAVLQKLGLLNFVKRLLKHLKIIK